MGCPRWGWRGAHAPIWVLTWLSEKQLQLVTVTNGFSRVALHQRLRCAFRKKHLGLLHCGLFSLNQLHKELPCEGVPAFVESVCTVLHTCLQPNASCRVKVVTKKLGQFVPCLIWLPEADGVHPYSRKKKTTLWLYWTGWNTVMWHHPRQKSLWQNQTHRSSAQTIMDQLKIKVEWGKTTLSS